LWGNVAREVVERRGASWPDYKDWQARSRSFERIAAHWGANYTLYGIDDPERLMAEDVDGEYFALVGVQPKLGRLLSGEDLRDGAAQTVVIGEGLWQRRFGSDPSAVGRTIRLDQNSYVVAGVVPSWFRGMTGEAELWVPTTKSLLGGIAQQRGSRWFSALAKLKPGISGEQAQREMNGISRQLEQEHPDTLTPTRSEAWKLPFCATSCSAMFARPWCC
jgi:hypothetical protein